MFQSDITWETADVDALSIDRATVVIAGPVPRGDYGLPKLPHQGFYDNDYVYRS